MGGGGEGGDRHLLLGRGGGHGQAGRLLHRSRLRPRSQVRVWGGRRPQTITPPPGCRPVGFSGLGIAAGRRGRSRPRWSWHSASGLHGPAEPRGGREGPARGAAEDEEEAASSSGPPGGPAEATGCRGSRSDEGRVPGASPRCRRAWVGASRAGRAGANCAKFLGDENFCLAS